MAVFLINRDAYGFPVRPQHVQRYREYSDIYKVLSPCLLFSTQDFHPLDLLEQLGFPFNLVMPVLLWRE